MIFTFWEGPKPAYIDLCMQTWLFEFVELNYGNLHKYTDLPMDLVKQYPLQQVSDIVRVHALRDNGGVWLDADTIVLGDLPEETILGWGLKGDNTIGFLQTEAHSNMFEMWASFQDEIMQRLAGPIRWSMFGNEFTDWYLNEYRDVKVGDILSRWPETYMIQANVTRREKYGVFYFGTSYGLCNIMPTDMIMLHNSWTPKKYKRMSRDKVLSNNCTLSNILREVLL